MRYSIVRCLMEGRIPQASVIERDIRYSWSGKNEDAKWKRQNALFVIRLEFRRGSLT
jgi:hypothetical protein